VENGGSVANGSIWLEGNGDGISEGGHWMGSQERRKCIGRFVDV
jgi:hypothetical protein